MAGDFNHTNLKSVLPKCHKNVPIGTWNGKPLDQVYTNIRGSSKTCTAVHLGQSDPLALFLTSYHQDRSRSEETDCVPSRVAPAVFVALWLVVH